MLVSLTHFRQNMYALADQLGIELAQEKFSEIAQAALALAFTRDPFDRLIVAQTSEPPQNFHSCTKP